MGKTVQPFGSAIEFSSFGKSTLAYVRRVNTDELQNSLAQEEGLPGDTDLWGLFGADGEPLALADEIGLLLNNADENNLVAMQRH